MHHGLPQRRHTRLHRDASADVHAVCAITVALKDRRALFADSEAAHAAIRVLRDRAVVSGVHVHAYCIMPDHAHLVLSPSATCELTLFVGQWKNLVNRELWRLGVVGAVWQRGFWDRFLRRPEAVVEAVRYVHENPVRAGLVQEEGMYAFSSAAGGWSMLGQPDVDERTVGKV